MDELVKNLVVLLFQFGDAYLFTQLIAFNASPQVDNAAMHSGTNKSRFMMLSFAQIQTQ